MANSPQVSIRIPPETLKRIDLLAQKLYPSRRAGKNPNRSQVILDAIAQYLEQHESSYTSTLEIDEQLDDKPINKVLQHYPSYTSTLEIDEQLDDKPINKVLQHYPKDIELATQYSKDIEPPMREYIDWWFDYFSYMKKLTDIWFGAK
ncbi:CopG family ribbon-helix-helix protein [Fischerella sp. PCC 9605]|uniref:CopG family ribbon-helix-helix protein n=1 Tax=Fischerella sp. PCC 9605 TaxID=1173024 RepID=UPI00047B6E4A|nr:ribbon-helix-helix domain-containing protein [Fischerella sp. PCC 9605]